MPACRHPEEDHAGTRYADLQGEEVLHIARLARLGLTEADVDKLITRSSQVRGIPAESLKTYRGMMVSDVVNGPRGKQAHEWAARQSYIALGNLMTCAAVLGVDTCPMEGFERAKIDELLNLLKTHRIKAQIDDQRLAGTPIEVTFHGTLRAEQQQAADDDDQDRGDESELGAT